MQGLFGLSPMELTIVGVVTLLLFGSRLPSIARSLDESMRAFRTCLYCGQRSRHPTHCLNCGRPRWPAPAYSRRWCHAILSKIEIVESKRVTWWTWTWITIAITIVAILLLPYWILK